MSTQIALDAAPTTAAATGALAQLARQCFGFDVDPKTVVCHAWEGQWDSADREAGIVRIPQGRRLIVGLPQHRTAAIWRKGNHIVIKIASGLGTRAQYVSTGTLLPAASAAQCRPIVTTAQRRLVMLGDWLWTGDPNFTGAWLVWPWLGDVIDFCNRIAEHDEESISDYE